MCLFQVNRNMIELHIDVYLFFSGSLPIYIMRVCSVDFPGLTVGS